MFVLQEALLGDVLRYRTPSTRFDLLLRGKPLDRHVPRVCRSPTRLPTRLPTHPPSRALPAVHRRTFYLQLISFSPCRPQARRVVC